MSNSVTLWTVAHQAPLSMGLSRQKCRYGLPCTHPLNLCAICKMSRMLKLMKMSFFKIRSVKGERKVNVSTFIQKLGQRYNSACTQSCPTPSDPMNVTRQSPLSVKFSRWEYWSGLRSPPPRDTITRSKNKFLEDVRKASLEEVSSWTGFKTCHPSGKKMH